VEVEAAIQLCAVGTTNLFFKAPFFPHIGTKSKSG
jgi:hypothetical protein